MNLELAPNGLREIGAALVAEAFGEMDPYPYYDLVTGVYGYAAGTSAIGVQGRGSTAGGRFTGRTGVEAASWETVAARAFGVESPLTGIGTPGLWVEGTSCCDGSSQKQHVAWLESLGGIGGDVLALQGSGSTPDEFTNFVTFFGDSTVLGEIQGDGSGGVEFDGSVVSPSADFAEFLPKLDTDEEFRPGDVVGLFAGKISRTTRGADRAMVISTHPIVAAGRPEPENAAQFEKVAFLGQVPVRVRGQVEAGDLLVPTGDQDGTAMAVTTSRLSPRQAQLLIGRSLESATGGEDSAVVEAMVGLPERASASALGAARREIQLYRWLLTALLLAGLAMTARRRRFV